VRLFYIVNPAARGGRAPAAAAVGAAARAAGLGGEVVTTAAPDDATRLAAAAAAAGAEVVVAVGGDGTAAEVAAGLLHTAAALAVLPAGSGNDLARQLGLPGDWRRALAALPRTRRRRIDTGRANGRLFLQSAGAGLDARVAALQARARRVPGRLAYAASAVRGLLTAAPRAVTLDLDGLTWSQAALSVTVANGETYGGGLRIAPGARNDDGQLEVAVFGDLGRLDALRTFPTVYRGAHLTHPRFRLLRGRRLTVTVTALGDAPLPVHADGDPAGLTPAAFTLHPRSLDVLAAP
jgi:YegS/Rv2252/BmrU family lipid kinase